MNDFESIFEDLFGGSFNGNGKKNRRNSQV